MKILKSILLLGCLMFLNACAGPTLNHYKGSDPKLDLKEYFSGPVKAWGLIQDRKGHVVRRFDVEMVGSWEGDVGTLKERFDYYDGQTDERVWTITKIDNRNYQGKAGDIIDKATGIVEGSAMRWNYRMDLDVGDSTYRITFDDWMFLMNDGVLINRSYLKKFGLTVAELTLFMQKQDES